MNINESKLNEMEMNIHKKLTTIVRENPHLKILEAADQCTASPSKISKYVKKLGFDNFKQYKLYFSGQIINQKKHSNEIERIKDYLKSFDETLVDKFLAQFNMYDKIVLFGLGPSYICSEYFAYKLNFVSDKKIFVTQESHSVQRLADPNTLVIIFSTTGNFSNFDALAKQVKENNSHIILILEEYNPNISKQIDNIFYLTDTQQQQELLPYEKTRTVFFIFIEEVITKLMKK